MTTTPAPRLRGQSLTGMVHLAVYATKRDWRSGKLKALCGSGASTQRAYLLRIEATDDRPVTCAKCAAKLDN